MSASDYLILAVVLLSGVLSLFRGFVKEAISLVAWVSAFIITSKFYEALAVKLTFFEDDVVRKAISCIILFVATLIVVGICGSIIRSLIQKVGLSGTDRLLGMVFGVLRGILIVCVILAILQIGIRLHIFSFVQDFYRDSIFIPELLRIVNWFFAYGPATPEEIGEAISNLPAALPSPSDNGASGTLTPL